MKFPLIKMAADPSLGKTWHDIFKKTPVAQFVSSFSGSDDASRKKALQPIYDSYVVYMTTLSDAAEKELAMKNIQELVTALTASPKAPQATPATGNASPAAQPKKTDTNKSGPHPGMTALQQKLNEYLAANPKEGVSPVKVTGYQGDQGTWGVIKKVWPQWFDGNKTKFKSYSQVTGWIEKEMSAKPAGAPDAQKAALNNKIVSEEDRQLVAAWRAFLQADSLNVGADVVSTYAAGSPKTVGSNIAKYIADGKMKTPVKAPLEAAQAHLAIGFPAEATKALAQGAAAAKKYKGMRKLDNK